MGAARAPRRTLIPTRRPPGLRLHTLTGPLYRIDTRPFSAWDWTPHSQPRYRFDPTSGGRRVRYAATTPHGAARERYRDTGSYIPPDHAGHYLVTLSRTAPLRVLDLRREAILDALGLDDRISTSHEPQVIADAQALSDLVVAWWGDKVHGIAYRSRTTPETSTNLALLPCAPVRGRSQTLHRARGFLDTLTVRHGFTIDF